MSVICYRKVKFSVDLLYRVVKEREDGMIDVSLLSSFTPLITSIPSNEVEMLRRPFIDPILMPRLKMVEYQRSWIEPLRTVKRPSSKKKSKKTEIDLKKLELLLDLFSEDN